MNHEHENALARCDEAAGPARYWRTLEELANTPEFREWVANEFPHGITLEGLSRRHWLQLMAASFMLAGVAGCRWEKTELAPFVHRPVGRIPGKPERYATAMDLAGDVLGLVATCIDGRPIKLEGNPLHPASLGATDTLAQAAVLELYDPDRTQNVWEKSGNRRQVRRWEDFLEEFRKQATATPQGEGWAFVLPATSSPTLRRLRRLLADRWPKARWHTYEPIHDDFVRQGTQKVLGQEARPIYRLDRVRVCLAVDADLFFDEPGRVRAAREFASTRDGRPDRMSRLYVVESRWTLTGAAADHRLPLAPRKITHFLEALEFCLRRLAAGQGLPEFPATSTDKDVAYRTTFLRSLAEDLWQNRGQSLVAAGTWLEPEAHAAACRINGLLGNVGGLVVYLPVVDPLLARSALTLSKLAEELRDGSVKNLVFLGTNPVYSAPPALGLARLIEEVPYSLHVGLYADETAAVCRWHVPLAHFLESWGDAEAWDGTYTVIQPTIEPLYQGRSAIEILGLLLDERKTAQQWVQETFRELFPNAEEADWERCLAQGLHRPEKEPEGLSPKGTQPQPEPSPESVSRFVSPQVRAEDGVQIVLTADYSVYDGRYANNAWLQEWPDPMTRLTWGNAAVMGVSTARRLRCQDGSRIVLEVDGQSVILPVAIVPGVAPDTVVVALGYGRTAAGHVGGLVAEGVAPVGVNAYGLRRTPTDYFLTAGKVAKMAGSQPLASVQSHHLIDRVGLQERAGRLGELVREVTLGELNDPAKPYSAESPSHHPPLVSLWPEHTYEGHRWAMAVDLSKCIGCGACVVACQAENNIPVVGPAQVLRSREMHWMRVDRYFSGDVEHPRSIHQPVMCQQCEMAPCEQVCPVAATVHSDEGLNDMVYNRCVGTRYCANNCPYKVRRFNYFYYHKNLDDPRNEVQKMVFNPEVTIRTRGVMEKCTYCVQRIQKAKIEAKNERRALRDGEIQTACQQVCPAQAIVFGDLADPQSEVAKLHRSPRAYALLGELNIKPRTKYLARVRNPHPALEALEDPGNKESVERTHA